MVDRPNYKEILFRNISSPDISISEKKIPSLSYKNSDKKSQTHPLFAKNLLEKENESVFNQRLDSFIIDTLGSHRREDRQADAFLRGLRDVNPAQSGRNHYIDPPARDIQRNTDILSQLQNRARRLPLEPGVPVDTIQGAMDKLSDFAKFGLRARRQIRYSYEVAIVVDGKQVLKPGDEYTVVDFMPGGRGNMDSSKITDSLASGIKGLTELVSAIDRGEVELVPILSGVTNLNMALICQRMGFKITDDCKTRDGKVDKTRTLYTVIGNLDDIRLKLAEFARSGLSQKVTERDARLKQKLQPA